jgi:hypothetical protein
LICHLHFFLEGGKVGAFLGHRHVVEVTFLLGQQLEPAVHRRLDQLGDSERQGSHEIVAGCSVPIPNLNQQPTVFVLGLQLTAQTKIAGFHTLRYQNKQNAVLVRILCYSRLYYIATNSYHYNRINTVKFEISALKKLNVAVLGVLNVHDKLLVPHWVEGRLDGFGLEFESVAVWDELQLDVGIRQTVGIHGNQVFALLD